MHYFAKTKCVTALPAGAVEHGRNEKDATRDVVRAVVSRYAGGRVVSERESSWPPPQALAAVRWVDPPHPATLEVDVLTSQCRMSQFKRGGPGGQHRNKTQTAIRWVHEPTGVEAQSNEFREQVRNRSVALRRLRIQLAIELRTRWERSPELIADQRQTDAVEPSPEWMMLQGPGVPQGLRVSPDHTAYPAVLARLLDDLHRSGGQPSLIKSIWGGSSSGIIQFLSDLPISLGEVNRWRSHLGFKPLRPS